MYQREYPVHPETLALDLIRRRREGEQLASQYASDIARVLSTEGYSLDLAMSHLKECVENAKKPLPSSEQDEPMDGEEEEFIVDL